MGASQAVMKTLTELLDIAENGGDKEYDTEFWMNRETVLWLIRRCIELEHDVRLHRHVEMERQAHAQDHIKP
jgi:hypothetical protein